MVAVVVVAAGETVVVVVVVVVVVAAAVAVAVAAAVVVAATYATRRPEKDARFARVGFRRVGCPASGGSQVQRYLRCFCIFTSS